MNIPSKTHTAPHTVLIVDDTPANLAVLVENLEIRGFRALVAQDGNEGLKRAERERPDLILLDVMMPGLDGFSVCRRLKNNEHTRDIPVIFMTALDEMDDKLAGFRAGAVDYITKPIQIAEVLARIDTHLTLHSVQRQLAAHNALLQHEIAVRQQAEAALQHARDELEERVAQRTAELEQTARHLQDRESRIRRLVESNVIGVFFCDLHGAITEANDEFLRIIGYTREELMGSKKGWTDMTQPQWHAIDERAIQELKQAGSCAPYEKEYIRKDGRPVPVLIGGALFEDSRDQGVAFVLDLTERKRAESRIRYLAHHDALTGLPNRALLQDRINQAITQAHRSKQHVAVLFIDLDNFKRINDSLGHETGDRLLQLVAARLQRCLREGDSVARLGGDEFVISLPALSSGNDAALIAQKVLAAMRRGLMVSNHQLHLTASIGIGVYPADGDDAQGLMRAADIAMYHAKERGRDDYQFFAPRLNEIAHQRLNMANRLHNALAHGELVLHYQPQVELGTGTMVSVEALLRWQPADAPLVSFGEFAGVAEETGLIQPIGEWVLREACRQLRRWYNEGHTGLRVAVNISPRQLRQPEFHALVKQILTEHDLPGSALEIEITESVLMLQTLETLAALEQLIAMGVQLAVDDFGVGYSNLSYLRRFPISTLKIDRSFVGGAGTNPNDTAIVTAIIAMATSLQLRIVAEGVETDEQLRFLKSVGCDAVQGFYFSAPVSANQITDFLRKPNRQAID
jgi:diguanylate cyclase (GGDEF)-like protein/PAS domain S-box-containing protein